MRGLGLGRSRRAAAQTQRVVEEGAATGCTGTAGTQGANSPNRFWAVNRRGALASSQQQSASERYVQGVLNPWKPAGLWRNSHR